MAESERKRAALFGDTVEEPDAPKMDLDKFQPKPAHEIDQSIADKITQEEGFTTGHGKTRASSNQQKRDGRRLKKSQRTTQFNVRLKPSNADRFWAGAEAEEMEYADDFLAHLLDIYEGTRNNGQ